MHASQIYKIILTKLSHSSNKFIIIAINEIIVINERGNSGKAHIIYRFSFIIAVMLINHI